MVSSLIKSIMHFKTHHILEKKNQSIFSQSLQTRHNCYKRDVLPIIASHAQSLINYFKIIY